jgi:hypothetical protein
MDGSKTLAVALVVVVAILAKGQWDRAPSDATTPPAAAPGGSSASPRAAPKPADTERPVAACTELPACSDEGDPICELERDFPGALAANRHAAAGPGPLPRSRWLLPSGAWPALPTPGPLAAVPWALLSGVWSGDATSEPLAAAPRVIVATLPTPLDAGLLVDFYQGLDAIKRAVQSQSYVLQRQWLPWTAKPTGAPGWLLFRRDHREGDAVTVEILLVLIVSEEPKRGIEPNELRGALTRFRTIADAAGDGEPAALSILGPSFSGSALSLVDQTRAWCAGCKPAFCAVRRLIAISGSATRRRTQAIVAGLTGVFKSSELHATVLPDDLLLAGMHRFIQERLQIPSREIADLTETSTVYGNAVATGEGRKPGDPVSLKIALPAHLAGLAEAHPDPGTDPPELTSSTKLELDAVFATLSRQGIHNVGVLATATEHKVYLAQHLRSSAPDLRVHMYEGSTALADPGQRAALEGVVVASSYPVLMTTQLWTQQERRPLLQFPSAMAEGVYNATLALQATFDPALQAALPRLLLDYALPFCNGALAGPSVWVSVSISGQLWPLAVYPPALAVESRRCQSGCDVCSSFDLSWAACQLATPDPYLFQPGAMPAPPPLPVAPSFITILGVALVLLLIAGNLIGLAPLRPESFWRLPLISYRPKARRICCQPVDRTEPRPPDRSSPLSAEGASHTIALMGLWALAMTAFGMGKVFDLPSLMAVPVAPHARLHVLSQLLVWGAFTLVTAACLLTVVRSSRSGRGQASALVQAGLCALLLAAILVIPLRCAIRHPDGHSYFFFLRAVDPGLGLTPTIPLFMIGLTIYVAALLRLLVMRRADRLGREARLWNPLLSREAARWRPTPPRSLNNCARAMADFATTAARSLLPAGLVGTALGFVVLFLTPLRLRSLEGRWFDGVCSFYFALIFTLTVAAAGRAHTLWFRLRRFTRALAIHPASAALPRLPGSVAARFRSPVPGQISNRQIDVALLTTLHAMGEVVEPPIRELVLRLDTRWFPLGERAGADDAKEATGVAPSSGAQPPLRNRTRAQLEEDLLALHMAQVLGLMCDATRTMLFIATGTGLAALLGCALYPFQPAATLTAAGLISVGLVILVALRVLLGIEKDPVLSEVAQTTPDKITPSLGLFARLVGYVIVPLGGLIGSRLQNQGTVVELLKSLTNTLNR